MIRQLNTYMNKNITTYPEHGRKSDENRNSKFKFIEGYLTELTFQMQIG